MELGATKPELRAELRRRLESIDPATARSAADRIAGRVLELPEVARAEAILTCLSFGAELDTWRLVDRLLESGREVFVPRADPKDRRLHVHRYPCGLRTLSFGLRQPRRDAPELAPEAIEETIGAAFVLGLGFDRRGYRLGYGGGYFDRFLAGRAFPAIGLAFQLQLVEEIPNEPHDVPMAVVVTEVETSRRRAAAGPFLT